MIESRVLREKFTSFWESKNHHHLLSAPLVLENDSTTLFTSSGMQQLVPNLSGLPHPLGKRLYNIQPCFRAVDIDTVGNNRHTTFFEMMGNWSLGDYFKEEQLTWVWEFYTKELSLPSEKVYVTVFEGDAGVDKDTETYNIWKKIGVKEDHIYFYGADKNWWSRAGQPEDMPEGEIGGPDTEVFYEFAEIPHDKKFGEECHPNCDCGRFLEIGNSVFIEYKKEKDGTLSVLPQKNVDFGGGLERLLMAVNNQPDVFKIDLFQSLHQKILNKLEKDINSTRDGRVRIFLDHSRAAIFMISEGLIPGKNEREYLVRRLIRRADDQLTVLRLDNQLFWSDAVLHFASVYKDVYSINWDKDKILSVIINELRQYGTVFKHVESLKKELFEVKSSNSNLSTASAIAGPIVFNYQTTYGVPGTVTQQVISEVGLEANIVGQNLDKAIEQHREKSRSASAGMFKGGLADHSEQVIKYHTATHLLHQALSDVLGDTVRQEGSNITGERLRFDFSFDRKPTAEELNKVEIIINEKIKESLTVSRQIMKKEEAEKLGARSFFKEKYGDEVSVYFIGVYSKEFCGGPHVTNTSEIGVIKITKLEKIGANLMRVYAE